EEVKRILSEIVKQRKGDMLESTATATGKVTRSKKGDFVLRFHEKPEAALVIEAKDEAVSHSPRSSGPSKKQWRTAPPPMASSCRRPSRQSQAPWAGSTSIPRTN